MYYDDAWFESENDFKVAFMGFNLYNSVDKKALCKEILKDKQNVNALIYNIQFLIETQSQNQEYIELLEYVKALIILL